MAGLGDGVRALMADLGSKNFAPDTIKHALSSRHRTSAVRRALYNGTRACRDFFSVGVRSSLTKTVGRFVFSSFRLAMTRAFVWELCNRTKIGRGLDGGFVGSRPSRNDSWIVAFSRSRPKSLLKRFRAVSMASSCLSSGRPETTRLHAVLC